MESATILVYHSSMDESLEPEDDYFIAHCLNCGHLATGSNRDLAIRELLQMMLEGLEHMEEYKLDDFGYRSSYCYWGMLSAAEHMGAIKMHVRKRDRPKEPEFSTASLIPKNRTIQYNAVPVGLMGC